MQTLSIASPGGGLARALVMLAALPLLLTACVVANPFAPKNTAAQDADKARLKWSQCMRDHGVNVSDPQTASGGGGAQTATSGGAKAGPADNQQFQDAVNACKRYAPNGSLGSGKVDPKTLDAMTKFAQCMRDHGIPMEDPKATSGGGVGVTIAGSGQDMPDPQSDQFKQAQQACQHYMDAVKPKSGTP